MRLRKQTPPAANGDHSDAVAKNTKNTEDTENTEASKDTKASNIEASGVDALALAEEAEAEAAEAEAVAAAARARARALRLRREAEEAKAAQAVAAAKPDTGEDTLEKGDDDDVSPGGVVTKEADVADADVDSEAVAAPDDAEEPAAKRVRKRRRPRFPQPSWSAVGGTLTVVLIVALLAACGYMYWLHRQAQDEQQRRAEFQAAARQGVVTLMSLDYKKAKEDVQRIIDNSTGQFKQDFESTKDDFINVAIDSKAITETNVTATAVESMTKDTATVLVAASSRVTNSAGAKQEPRAWRLSVNLARDGGQLKLAKVEFVP